MVEARLPSLPPHHPPISEYTESRVRSRSSRVEFVLGVTWFAIVLTGLVQWVIRTGLSEAYYIQMVCFLPYFLLFRLPQFARLSTYPQFWMWVLTAGMPVLLYLVGQNDPWATESMKARILFFSVVAGSSLVLITPDARRILRTSALITLGVAIPICFVELFVPNIFSTAEGRSAGLYGNPNEAGCALLICLIFALDLRRVTNSGLLLISSTTVAVITTFSRSGMIFAAGFWAWYALLPDRQRVRHVKAATGQQRLLLLFGIAMATVIGILLINQYVNLSDGAIGRLASLLTGNVTDDSATSRLDKVTESSSLIRKQFWGQGMGYVERTQLGPHNTFLYLGVDYGVPGILFYMSILAMGLLTAMRAGWVRESNAIFLALLLIWSSLFTHYVAGTGFFAAAFAALATGALILPREPRRAETPVKFDPSLPRDAPSS